MLLFINCMTSKKDFAILTVLFKIESIIVSNHNSADFISRAFYSITKGYTLFSIVSKVSKKTLVASNASSGVYGTSALFIIESIKILKSTS